MEINNHLILSLYKPISCIKVREVNDIKQAYRVVDSLLEMHFSLSCFTAIPFVEK